MGRGDALASHSRISCVVVHLSDIGASLFEDHAMVHEDGIQMQVPAINFSDYLARNFRPEDIVIIRCDIEGAEYEVLKSLIVAGTARLVDYIDVEWHAMLSPSLHHLKQAMQSALLAGRGLTLHFLQADTVLPWLLEGFGTRVKVSSLIAHFASRLFLRSMTHCLSRDPIITMRWNAALRAAALLKCAEIPSGRRAKQVPLTEIQGCFNYCLVVALGLFCK
jgi:hypothetical protein